MIKMSWDAWIKAVDEHMERIAGCTSGEISDWWYRDAYNEDMDPKDAALQALQSDGLDILCISTVWTGG